LRTAKELAEWQVHLMIAAMRAAAVPIPDGVFRDRPRNGS
jgi:hypothetical protein